MVVVVVEVVNVVAVVVAVNVVAFVERFQNDSRKIWVKENIFLALLELDVKYHIVFHT